MAKLKIPSLNLADPIVTPEFRPTRGYHAWLNGMRGSIQSFVNDQAQLLADIAFSLQQAGIAITTAQEVAAKLAAGEASTALQNSYVTPSDILTSTLSGAVATINIAVHTRTYGDGVSVSVNAGSVTGLAANTYYYVVYDDDVPRQGGNVSYQAITDYAAASQTGDRHLVGSIQTATDGSSPPPPGEVVYPPGVPRRGRNPDEVAQ